MANINKNNNEANNFLLNRKKGIGGSDVPAILGFSKYKTPLDIYFDKINPEIIELQPNAKMIAGKKLEDVVADWFAEETGLSVRKKNNLITHKQHPFLIGNVDRVISENNIPGILEIKTTSSYVASSWDAGEVPLHYFAQLQHYLNITGYSFGFFAVLIDGYDFRIYRQERDEEFIQMMLQPLFKFWYCVENKIPPAPINREEVQRLFPKHFEGNFIEASEDTFKTYMNLKEIRTQLKELEAKEETLKDSLCKVIRDAEGITYNGNKIITWKQSKDKLIFDKETFKKENETLYQKYLSTQKGSRMFLVK